MNLLDAVARSSRQQQVLRATALVTPLLFLAAVPLAGGVFHPLLTLVGVLLAGLVALLPESNAPLGTVLFLGLLWALSVPETLDLWTLLAAADLLVLHVACTLLSYGPAGLSLDAALLALWRRRAALCLGAALLVWALAKAVDVLDLPPSATGVGLALLLVLGWVTVLTLRLRSDRTA